MERQRPITLPVIKAEDPFVQVVKKLSFSIIDAIKIPSSFEGLRTTTVGDGIRELVEHLSNTVENPALVHALLILKWHFSSIEKTADDRGLSASRANACEIVAWRFLARLSERDVLDYCLYELPVPEPQDQSSHSSHACGGPCNRDDVNEDSSLLPQFRASRAHHDNASGPPSQKQKIMRSVSAIENLLSVEGGHDDDDDDDDDEGDPTTSFAGLNALEIAAVADAKQFLSQRTVQTVINGIWYGDVTFWGSMSAYTKKKAQFYNKNTADPYSRLRVPRYIKLFEVLFFTTFLALYYAVLVERNPAKITPLVNSLSSNVKRQLIFFQGVMLYVWIAAFAYDELSEFWDAGTLFYAVDFWNAWDLCIISVGGASFTTNVIGLLQHDDRIIDTAFDILSLEALFLVPRICSVLSLHPYFGTLIPCLKQMAQDFVKFMSVVLILYVAFLTTFIMLARDHLTPGRMAWILVKVFFGSSYLGFDVMHDISPVLGPPLMLVFVGLTTILLVTSLISILSASFADVTGRAREEYLFVYSVYVLEASTSNRLTRFYPPLNLLPLLFLRPLRLLVPSAKLRPIRIYLLKITHSPIVALIWLLESLAHALAHHGASPAKPKWKASSAGTIGSRPTEGAASRPRARRPFLLDRASAQERSAEEPLTSPGDAWPAEHASTPIMATGRGSPTIRSRKEGRRDGEQDGRKGPGTLEGKVDELTARVAELTALMLAQQARETGTVAPEDD